MGQVAARRAVSDAVAVDEEDEAVVGADAHQITGGNGSQRELAAEVEHQRLPQRGRGVRDPRCLPIAVGRVRLGRCLGVASDGKGNGDECEG